MRMCVCPCGVCHAGMEVASYMIDKATSITVIGSSELPYQKTLGPEIGKITMTVRKEKQRKSISCCSALGSIHCKQRWIIQMSAQSNRLPAHFGISPYRETSILLLFLGENTERSATDVSPVCLVNLRPSSLSQ